MSVGPPDHQGPVRDGVELLERRQARVVPAGLVVALEIDGAVSGRGDLAPRRRRQQIASGPGGFDVGVGEREPGRGEMDVGVDEPWHDRGAGQVDHPVGGRGFARPDALDVPPVDQQPLPRLGIGLGPDASGAVKGPHGARSIAR